MVQVMRKADLIRKNMVQSVQMERNILAMANNPFVVGFCMLCCSEKLEIHGQTGSQGHQVPLQSPLTAHWT